MRTQLDRMLAELQQIEDNNPVHEFAAKDSFRLIYRLPGMIYFVAALVERANKLDTILNLDLVSPEGLAEAQSRIGQLRGLYEALELMAELAAPNTETDNARGE